MIEKKYGLSQALPKIRNYCAYQERSHSEVKDKLYSFGLHKEDVEKTISQMIEENYLNEQRFAIQFAGGKFRLNKWGRVKIKYALKQKRVSDYCIRIALQQIDENAYQSTLLDLLEKKEKTIKGERNKFTKRRKLQQYLVQKGFETELIQEELKKLIG